MSNIQKRYIIAVGLLIITAILTFGAFSKGVYSDKLYTADIPLVIGSWYGIEITMDERTYELLETKDTIMREYINTSGDKVVLTVVYSKENIRVVHAPDICLSGGGSNICDEAIETVSFGDKPKKHNIFNRFTVENGSEKQIVLFLYKTGKKTTPKALQMQFNFFINKALRRSSHSVALIRFSSYAINGDTETATRKTKQFAAEAMPVLLKYLP
jgi:EpsI family protein